MLLKSRVSWQLNSILTEKLLLFNYKLANHNLLSTAQAHLSLEGTYLYEIVDLISTLIYSYQTNNSNSALQPSYV